MFIISVSFSAGFLVGTFMEDMASVMSFLCVLWVGFLKTVFSYFRSRLNWLRVFLAVSVLS